MRRITLLLTLIALCMAGGLACKDNNQEIRDKHREALTDEGQPAEEPAETQP